MNVVRLIFSVHSYTADNPLASLPSPGAGLYSVHITVGLYGVWSYYVL